MFLLVGKGMFLKDNLVSKLQEWGIGDASTVVTEAEKKGRIEYGRHRILYIR